MNEIASGRSLTIGMAIGVAVGTAAAASLEASAKEAIVAPHVRRPGDDKEVDVGR